MSHDLSSHLEDYLEVILRLAQRGRVVHASEVADALGVTRASVTGALRSLSQRGLIDYQPYQPVHLTAAGEAEAQKLFERHQQVLSFFTNVLQLPPSEAHHVACRCEHFVSERALARLVELRRFWEECSASPVTWENDRLTCSGTPSPSSCSDCPRRTVTISD